MSRPPSAKLVRISVHTSLEAEEAVMELMRRLFRADPVAFCPADQKFSRITVYCRSGQNRPRQIRTRLRQGLQAIAKSGLPIQPARIRITHLKPENWAESWKRHFKPIKIGRSLVVQPSWIRARPKVGQIIITLDPGLSFGTGHHPTTEFCLRQLAAHAVDCRGESFLDIGTGSGILAIAAAKLGYHPIMAIDHDPEAVRIARINASHNHVDHLISFFCRDLTRWKIPAARFRFVCANLQADLLIAQCPNIARGVYPGGWLVLAGILESQSHSVLNPYRLCGFNALRTQTRKKWFSTICQSGH